MTKVVEKNKVEDNKNPEKTEEDASADEKEHVGKWKK